MSLGFYLEKTMPVDVFGANITHNLGEMADHAGVYECLWHPKENGYTKAVQIIPILESGLVVLLADPEHFKQYDAPNGWGTYKNFVTFVQKCLDACRKHPDAVPRSSV